MSFLIGPRYPRDSSGLSTIDHDRTDNPDLSGTRIGNSELTVTGTRTGDPVSFRNAKTNRDNVNKNHHPKYEDSRYHPIKRQKKYGSRKKLVVQVVYVISAILWAVLIAYFGFYRTTRAGILILLIPFFVYGLGAFNAKDLTIEVEESVFAANYLSIGLLIVLPLLTWMDKRGNNNIAIVTEAMIVAIVLSLLSLVDIWIRPKWLSVVKHIKSVLQTAALTLLVFALYMFYIGRVTDGNIHRSQVLSQI